MATSEKFEHLCSKWIADAFKLKPSQVPEVVYHYTDASGLYGVLKSGRLWAADHRFLNDKSEIVHSKLVSQKVIKIRKKSEHDKVISNFLDRVLDYHDTESLDNTYLYSFSSHPDDLSQWRGYARDGQGFTIGLSGPSLASLTDGDEAQFSFCRVEYEEKTQESCCQKIVEDFCQSLKVEVSKNPSQSINLIEEAAHAYDYVIDSRSAVNKHASFKSESEWRLVSFVEKSDPDQEVRVRLNGDRLQTYIELSASAGKPLPITRLGIGPGFVGSEVVHAVQTLCKETGYDPEIYYANTPYRRL